MITVGELEEILATYPKHYWVEVTAYLADPHSEDSKEYRFSLDYNSSSISERGNHVLLEVEPVEFESCYELEEEKEDNPPTPTYDSRGRKLLRRVSELCKIR